MAYGGLEGRENLRNGVKGVVARELKDTRDTGLGLAELIAEAGANDIMESIRVTPSSLRPGKTGRVLSGKMLHNVGASFKRTGNTYTARAGWIGEKERYFHIQEHGGVGYGIYKGINIQGMFALRDARKTMEKMAKDMRLEFE